MFSVYCIASARFIKALILVCGVAPFLYVFRRFYFLSLARALSFSLSLLSLSCWFFSHSVHNCYFACFVVFFSFRYFFLLLSAQISHLTVHEMHVVHSAQKEYIEIDVFIRTYNCDARDTHKLCVLMLRAHLIRSSCSLCCFWYIAVVQCAMHRHTLYTSFFRLKVFARCLFASLLCLACCTYAIFCCAAVAAATFLYAYSQ